MKQKIVKVEQYVSEINILELLEPLPTMNLLVAPTSAGKTTALMNLAKQNDFVVAFTSPFTAINEQVQKTFSDFNIQTGTKTTEQVSVGKNVITTFHSVVRLLEMTHLDLLIIDEIHQLVNYSGYADTILNPFWETMEKLKKKHPHMKIVAATGTPQFIRQYAPFNLSEIIIVPKIRLGDKIRSVEVGSWGVRERNTGSYIYLYRSIVQGTKLADTHSGAFISSKSKDVSLDYHSIVSSGELLSERTFTSTLLATGVSILSPVDKVITQWGDVVDIVQFASRVRSGYDRLLVTKSRSLFYTAKHGMPKPVLKWTGDFRKDMQLLLKFQSWFSYELHIASTDRPLRTVIMTMLQSPEVDIVQQLGELL